jgi:hypothetical protein
VGRFGASSETQLRASNVEPAGYVYHPTSRCHDRTFLLKSAVWRNEYRRRLHEALHLFDVYVLTIADNLRGRAKLKMTEIGDSEWTVSDCYADDPLGGATLLGDDDLCHPGSNEWPLVS